MGTSAKEQPCGSAPGTGWVSSFEASKPLRAILDAEITFLTLFLCGSAHLESWEMAERERKTALCLLFAARDILLPLLSLPLFPHPGGQRRWHNLSCLKPGICRLYGVSLQSKNSQIPALSPSSQGKPPADPCCSGEAALHKQAQTSDCPSPQAACPNTSLFTSSSTLKLGRGELWQQPAILDGESTAAAKQVSLTSILFPTAANIGGSRKSRLSPYL